MSENLSWQQAEARRDAGMELAVEKADRDREGWSGDALDCVEMFCKAHGAGHQFLTETVRLYAETFAIIEAPENERAWGAVMRRAAKDGLIRKAGYAPAASSNLSPKVLWEVA
jgi:hypothetical protein